MSDFGSSGGSREFGIDINDFLFCFFIMKRLEAAIVMFNHFGTYENTRRSNQSILKEISPEYS